MPKRINAIRNDVPNGAPVATTVIATAAPTSPAVPPAGESKSILATGNILANNQQQDGARRVGTANQVRATYEL